MKITALLDNKMSEHKSLKAEHGLSLYVEYNGKKILFDFGASDVVLHNAKKLNVNLKNLDYMVCSHAHYDHASGLKFLLEANCIPEHLIIGDGFWNSKYAFDGVKHTYLGTGYNEELLEKNNINYDVCKSNKNELFKGCYVFTNFSSSFDFETIPERFVIENKEGSFERDFFLDEIALAFETEKGIVVLVGCSHPGILNILSTIKTNLNKNIYAVIGGSHLVEANDERINVSINEMKKMGVELTAFSHCSGDQVNVILAERECIKNTHLATGDVLFL